MGYYLFVFLLKLFCKNRDNSPHNTNISNTCITTSYTSLPHIFSNVILGNFHAMLFIWTIYSALFPLTIQKIKHNYHINATLRLKFNRGTISKVTELKADFLMATYISHVPCYRTSKKLHNYLIN